MTSKVIVFGFMLRCLGAMFWKLLALLLERLLFTCSPNKEKPPIACIVRIDAIGDYILFRQALRSLRFSPRLTGKKIVFCGNAVWRELAEYLDADCFDEFIPIDCRKFRSSRLYRKITLLAIKYLGAVIALNPTFSRNYWGDILIAATGAREKIGFYSIPQNISPDLKQITDKLYTELIPYQETFSFEVVRNQEFLHYLGVPQQDIQPFHHALKPRLNNDTHNNICFFIGASDSHRRWPVEYWLELAHCLAHDYELPVVWLGGQDCKDDVRKIITSLPANSHNLVGNTSLVELLHIISDARLMVTHDSMGLHFAAMLAIPHIVISNGQHAGRFHPYPADIAPKGFAVYPEGFGSATPDNVKKYYYAQSPFSIATISVERVYTILAHILKTAL